MVTVYDERGPIPMYKKLTRGKVFNEEKWTTIMVRKGNNEIHEVLMHEYGKWFPKGILINDTGYHIPGHRPWITTHSVKNIVTSLKLDQRKSRKSKKELDDIQIEIKPGDIRESTADQRTLIIKLKPSDAYGNEEKEVLVHIPMESEYEEISKLVKKENWRRVRVPIHTNMRDQWGRSANDERIRNIIHNLMDTGTKLTFEVAGYAEKNEMLQRIEEISSELRKSS